jgi:hypothetical protein
MDHLYAGQDRARVGRGMGDRQLEVIEHRSISWMTLASRTADRPRAPCGAVRGKHVQLNLDGMRCFPPSARLVPRHVPVLAFELAVLALQALHAIGRLLVRQCQPRPLDRFVRRHPS